MTRPGRDAPAAVPYDVMPAYRATAELLGGLEVLACRLGPASGIDRALRERGVRLLLSAAEGGARAELWRRILHYRYAWFGTFDLNRVLDSARDQRLVPADAMLGTDTVFRMAQQALTLAAGTMMERDRNAEAGG